MFFSLLVCFHYKQQALFTEMGHPVKNTMLLLENQFFMLEKSQQGLSYKAVQSLQYSAKMYTSLSQVKSYCQLKILILLIHFLRDKK